MAGNWTSPEMVRLGAGPATLVVPAFMVVPVTFQARAGWVQRYVLVDLAPGCRAVSAHVFAGNGIRDALVAKRSEHGIE